MKRVIEANLAETDTCVAVADGEVLIHKLEKVFQIFRRAQEDWAMTHDPGLSSDGMEKDSDLQV